MTMTHPDVNQYIVGYNNSYYRETTIYYLYMLLLYDYYFSHSYFISRPKA